MKLMNQGPLTESEIEELDRFLLDSPGLEESMDISTLDGFLTAIVGADGVGPVQWLVLCRLPTVTWLLI